jgi:transcriptional regulator with XRE-family HTH domain
MVVPVSYLRLPHLRQWRLREGLTQEDLAELAGVSRSTVHNAEADKEVLPSTLQRLARAFKVKPRELQHLPPDD